MKRGRYLTTWLVGILALSALLIVACGGAAEPEPAAPAEPAAVGQPTATPVPDATATPAPTATPLPEDVATAQDSIVLVVPEEPVNLNSFLSIGGSLYASITRANLQDPLTWQSGDDLRIVPTGASTGWEQIDAGHLALHAARGREVPQRRGFQRRGRPAQPYGQRQSRL